MKDKSKKVAKRWFHIGETKVIADNFIDNFGEVVAMTLNPTFFSGDSSVAKSLLNQEE